MACGVDLSPICGEKERLILNIKQMNNQYLSCHAYFLPFAYICRYMNACINSSRTILNLLIISWYGTFDHYLEAWCIWFMHALYFIGS